MLIKKARLGKLKNEEFYQFFREFKALVAKYAVDPAILAGYDKLLLLMNELDIALEQVRKSLYTKKIEVADFDRELTFRKLRDLVKFLSRDAEDAEQQDAADQLLLLLKQYDLRKKGYANTTASIFNLVQDLEEKYANEVDTLNLRERRDKLAAENNEFEALYQARTEEKGLKPQKRAVDLRKEMDECYGYIVRSLEVETIRNSSHTLTDFINELNATADNYRQLLAVRHGRAKAKKMKNEKGVKELEELK